MSTSSSPAVEEALERLCHKGCKSVWSDILSLEQGLSLPETASLSPMECAQVLVELRNIMTVYEGSCESVTD